MSVRTFLGHTDHVKDISFAPDGKTIASASFDGTIKVWQIEAILDLDGLVQQGCDKIQDYRKTHSELDQGQPFCN